MIEASVVVIVLLLGSTIYFYNRLIKARNFVKDAWAGIEVQLTKRHDLIPMLVTTVKAYSSHESELQRKVVELRTPNLSPDAGVTEAKELGFADALSKLFVLIEDYPDLKADANFRQLHEQLVEVEADIESARRYYNGTVCDFTILMESFPSNIVAKVFQFTSAPFFKLRVASVVVGRFLMQ